MTHREHPSRHFIRSKPKPTIQEALNFARSVMVSKGVDTNIGPYVHADGITIKQARRALYKHAIDHSEHMALEMIEYSLS